MKTPIAHYKFGLTAASSLVNHGSATLTPGWHATSGSPSGPASVDSNSIKLSSLYAFDTGVKMGRVGGHTILVAVKLVEANFTLIAGGGSQVGAPQFNFGPQLYYLGTSSKLLHVIGTAVDTSGMCDPGWQIIGYSLAADLSAVKLYGTGKYGLIGPATTSNAAPPDSRILSLGGGNYATSPNSTQTDFGGCKIFEGALTDAEVLEEIGIYRQELKRRGVGVL